MLNRSKSGSSFSASVARQSGSVASGKTAGLWDVECHAPVAVTDIQKLGYLVGRHGIALPALLLPGHVSHKWVTESLYPFLKRCDAKLKQEIERLMYGGRLLWSDSYHNLIVNTGLDEYLNKVYKASSYTAAHYVGLADGTPTPAAGDTMSSHAGWAEVTGYSESVRQTLTLGTVSSQSVSNTASKATFTASGSITVGGCFLTTDSTKGGTSGTLMSIGAFSGGDKSLTAAETISVTVTLTMADDGA
jgi:hypothetical protein